MIDNHSLYFFSQTNTKGETAMKKNITLAIVLIAILTALGIWKVKSDA